MMSGVGGTAGAEWPVAEGGGSGSGVRSPDAPSRLLGHQNECQHREDQRGGKTDMGADRAEVIGSVARILRVGGVALIRGVNCASKSSSRINCNPIGEPGSENADARGADVNVAER